MIVHDVINVKVRVDHGPDVGWVETSILERLD
jgi:hypothetical protein